MPKRPLLPADDRKRLNALADNAIRHRSETGTNQAYAQGAIDALRWLTGADYDMSPLLQEVTR